MLLGVVIIMARVGSITTGAQFWSITIMGIERRKVSQQHNVSVILEERIRTLKAAAFLRHGHIT